MKNSLHLTFFFLLAGTVAMAQFPGGGPGGRPSGDGNGRSRPGGDAPTFSLESNAPRGNSKITGFVVDSAVTKAVEYATIALIDKTTKKPIDGTVADEKGKFSMNRIAEGEYRILITFIGYNEKLIDNIKIEKGKDLDLGVIKLSENTVLLDAVNVTGEKSLIEEKVDRLVYNAEKDLTSQGGDASDILRKVPMLSVDLDGNVSLRGSANIRVLINNKPSTIVASSIADALKMIPAELIKSVEVITSPSAKYDAEGSGGIINIITKKSTLQGLTLNVDTGIGLRGSNLGLNGSFRQGKLGVTLGGFGRAFYNKARIELDQSTIQNGSTILTRQSADAFDNGLFGRYNLGFDYDLAKNQSLTAGVNFGTRNFVRSQDYTTNLFRDNLLSSTLYRNVDTRDLSNTVDINMDYIRTFKPGQEWSVSTLYSTSTLTNNFDADILSESGSLTSRQKNLNNNTNSELTVQTDYVNPIGKNQQIEFGVKGILREVNSDFRYQVAGPTGLFASDVRSPAGLLNYNQNIAAGYLSYMFTTSNKYTFKLGSRYEYTSIDAYDQNSTITIPAYSNLVPSVNISKALSKSSTLKLAYNRRIQRPGLQQLNPNFNAANPQNINIGNPYLRPELTDNVELSLSTSFKKTYLNISLFSRSTNNGITRLAMPSDTLPGAIITTWENIGREQATGANVFGNVYLTPKWTLNGGVDLYYNYLEGMQQNLRGISETVSNSGFVIGGRVQSQLQLPHGWGLQAFGGYRGNRVQLQGYQRGMGMYSLGFRKDFPNKKGSLGLAAENFFGGMRIVSSLNSPLFNQQSTNYIYNQNVKLTFSYKIGKMSFVEKKKTKGVRNDDVKSGGGEGMN
ncbi:TonB-dependent receptor domain-containing protein [Telluribacter sp.]|jgi:outer membrane receptor protein involved in Fe transport|uniref:TonB-dependent receptor domain-containing protein n=1 Tax=Telluribacter sp. TaxID=1978767 RepID=UPI002E14C461|nr:TonB-dependent receptor [Telluribacter sp.]